MSKQKNPPYLQARIEPLKLREAAQKVFAYDKSKAKKNSVGAPAPPAKHRNPAQKGEAVRSS